MHKRVGIEEKIGVVVIILMNKAEYRTVQVTSVNMLYLPLFNLENNISLPSYEYCNKEII